MIRTIASKSQPDIDDLRESPSLKIVHKMAQEDMGELLVVDPFLKKLPNILQEFTNTRFVDLEIAIKEADIVLLLVDHTPFRTLDRSKLTDKIVFDTRGIWR